MLKKALIGALTSLLLFGGVAQAATPSRYTVRAGDTFAGIAWRNNVTVSHLAALNPQVQNLNLIYVGQQLNLPYPEWEKKADAILAMGQSYWGTPYVYGAKRFQDKSFDCSSFVQYLFSKQGIALGWNAREQAVQGTWVPLDQIRKGDLLFFWDDGFPNEQGLSKVRHVAIYMGDGKILHTYEEGIGVTISTIRDDDRMGNYWYTHFLFAKRVIQ